MKPQPIIPWIGGKRRLANQIIETFTEHTCYVEPFCGAAAIFFTKERVKVEVLSPAGLLVDTINLATTAAGRHDVAWSAGKELDNVQNYRFRVSASTGATPIDATSLMRDTVDAVNTGGTSLTVELARTGRVAYNQITALD